MSSQPIQSSLKTKCGDPFDMRHITSRSNPISTAPSSTQVGEQSSPISRRTSFSQASTRINPSELESGGEDRRTQSDTSSVPSNIREKDTRVNVEEPPTPPEPTAAEHTPRPRWHPISLAWLVFENWFLGCIPIFIILAWQFPQVGRDGGCKC